MTNPMLENWNYYSDTRVCKRAPGRYVIHISEKEVELPTKWMVCPLCNGKGTHINPSIDAGGLTWEDFEEDPDFAADYKAGMYDIPCNKCTGKRVIKVPNYDRMTTKEKEAYEKWQKEEAEYEAMVRAERRMEC